MAAGHFSLVHRHPVVLHTADWELFDPVFNASTALWEVLDALPTRRSYLLVSPSWTLRDEHTRIRLRSAVENVRDNFEHVEVVLLGTTTEDVVILHQLGLSAVHCSQNALVREDFFFPIPGARRRFDAIYDAKWADFKRHHLAASVESLALIAYPLPQSCTFAYFEEALPLVRHATWFTKPWLADPPYLAVDEVNRAYNQARVGLCLSAREGPNFATVQYLLAGLPVVTTANEGGRDEFLSHSVARWVDDDPDAVAAAVAELCARGLEPLAIRREALWKVAEHRARLRTWMRGVIDDNDGRPGWWSVGWPPDLANKLTEFEVPADDVVAHLADDEPTPVASAARPGVVLTPREREHFWHEGFLVVDRPLVSPAEVREVRVLLDDLVDRFDELPDDLAYDLGDVKQHDGSPQIPEISRALQLQPALGQTAAFARCQELAHQLLSGRAFCDYDHAIYKPPSDDTTVAWHQDLAFAPELEAANEVHIWFALQDVDETNGCMQYVPKSVVARLLPHRPRSESAHALVTDEIDPATAVSCPIGSGMVTVHALTTPHHTGPNLSDEVRAAWILHFVDHGD